MSSPPLLDEMFSDAIAQQLRAKGHDVVAAVADPALASLPDDQILSHAAATGRALVTANIKDFMPLDSQYRAAGQAHAGLVLVSTKTFPQDRSYNSAVTGALAVLLDKDGIEEVRSSFSPGPDVHFYARANAGPGATAGPVPAQMAGMRHSWPNPSDLGYPRTTGRRLQIKDHDRVAVCLSSWNRGGGIVV